MNVDLVFLYCSNLTGRDENFGTFVPTFKISAMRGKPFFLSYIIAQH